MCFHLASPTEADVDIYPVNRGGERGESRTSNPAHSSLSFSGIADDAQLITA